jgi:hypothetical protein
MTLGEMTGGAIGGDDWWRYKPTVISLLMDELLKRENEPVSSLSNEKNVFQNLKRRTQIKE